MSRNQFCPFCDVSLDLHGTNSPEPADCVSAARKADVLALMDRAFGVRRG